MHRRIASVRSALYSSSSDTSSGNPFSAARCCTHIIAHNRQCQCQCQSVPIRVIVVLASASVPTVWCRSTRDRRSASADGREPRVRARPRSGRTAPRRAAPTCTSRPRACRDRAPCTSSPTSAPWPRARCAPPRTIGASRAIPARWRRCRSCASAMPDSAGLRSRLARSCTMKLTIPTRRRCCHCLPRRHRRGTYPARPQSRGRGRWRRSSTGCATTEASWRSSATWSCSGCSRVQLLMTMMMMMIPMVSSSSSL